MWTSDLIGRGIVSHASLSFVVKRYLVEGTMVFKSKKALKRSAVNSRNSRKRWTQGVLPTHLSSEVVSRGLGRLPEELLVVILATVFVRDEVEGLVALLQVSRAWRAATVVALRSANPSLMHHYGEDARCPVCLEALTNAHEPLASPCHHLLCTACAERSPLSVPGDDPTERKVLRCPSCRHPHDSMRRCRWVGVGANAERILATGRAFDFVERRHTARSLAGVMRLETAEAERLDQVALTMVVRTVQRAGHDVTWWDLVGSQLLVIEGGGRAPRGVKPGDRLSAARISGCAQCNLHHIGDETLVQLLSNDERVYDVVFRELQWRASRGRLRFREI